MNRFIPLILLAVFGAALAPAQRGQSKDQDRGVVHATAQLAYVKVRNPDGTYSISRGGGGIPITIQPIKAKDQRRLSLLNLLRKPTLSASLAPRSPSALPPLFNTTVYQNDQGSFYVADFSPSILDDLVLTAAANNKAWKIVSFGVHISDGNRAGQFLVRWRGFETYTTGLGPGVMAFSDEMFDFGFYIPRNIFDPGEQTFIVQVDLTLNPLAIVPNQTCFFAQQFREPHPGGPSQENGEGPFTAEWNVFAGPGPQIGTSEDLFWYDTPPDGIYDETEPDNFGPDFPNTGNFLLNIQVGGGSTTTVNPFTFNWVRGVYQSGNVGSLWFDDSNYNIAKAGLVLFPSEPPAQIVVESFSPTSLPTGLRIDADARVNTPGLSMRVEMWNFTTSAYVQVASGPVGTTDTRLIGFAATPAQFVQSGTGTIRAKVSFYRTGLTLVWPWTASVDQIVWTITNS